MSDGLLESDRALLDQFRKGEKSALARVFRHYVGDVASVVRRGVTVKVDGAPIRTRPPPEHEIEAVVQETFVRAFQPQARDAYDGLRPFGAWLATIARNLLVDRARKSKRETLIEEVDDVADDAPADPAWRVEEERLSHIIQSLVATLEPLDQKIYQERMCAGRTHSETARVLGISEITVRRRDTRLRTVLLERLRTEGYLQDKTVLIGQSLLARRKEG